MALEASDDMVSRTDRAALEAALADLEEAEQPHPAMTLIERIEANAAHGAYACLHSAQVVTRGLQALQEMRDMPAEAQEWLDKNGERMVSVAAWLLDAHTDYNREFPDHPSRPE